MAKRSAGGAVDISMVGDRELERQLKRLDLKLQKKIVVRALRDAAKIVQVSAKARVPVGSGALRRNIRVRATKRTRRGTIGRQVIVGQGWYMGEQFYGAFIEFGHHVGSRKLGAARTFVPPRPYMRPALAENRRRVLGVLRRQIAQGIREHARARPGPGAAR